ncbi:MAG: tRNA 4-thiouridine(8) synthase ThiI [Defluviitaleaceae bacterium]|nr:tRNA 4-thiouridine(8) synthase ThiI [Defluviitaleaceae bacterium]
MMDYQEVLLIKYGEVALRKGNRHIYENMLMDAIRKNLADSGVAYKLYKEQGRIILRSEDTGLARHIPRISCIFGITSVCSGIKLANDKNMDNVKAACIAYTKEHIGDLATFKVTTKRADKAWPGRSDEISADIGGFILESLPSLKVDVKNPDFNLMVEIRNDIYIYSQTAEVEGLGGLPPGSAGKGVLLLSGGIDSPVAGFLAAKRGVDITAVYFHAPPYTSERAKDKVVDIAKQLSHFTGRLKLYIVNFTHIQLHLADNTPPEKITILLKRSMLKITDKVAERENALALITGDAVGQVASQTLHSLKAMAHTTDLPIIRPLACFDKKDIVDIAKKIGTFEISIRPFDDCCTLFLPKHPETKPKLSIIQNIERDVPNLLEMYEKAIEEAEIIKF